MIKEQQSFDKALAFLDRIGIRYRFDTLPDNTFLPGLLITGGHIVIDLQRLQHPGDLLHEAGHIATVAASERATLSGDTIGDREQGPAEEMMAMAWSYAACKELSIDPYFVFHETGYKGAGHHIADQFNAGYYMGVPLLEWTGMAARKELNGPPPYPSMLQWLRD